MKLNMLFFKSCTRTSPICLYLIIETAHFNLATGIISPLLSHSWRPVFHKHLKGSPPPQPCKLEIQIISSSFAESECRPLFNMNIFFAYGHLELKWETEEGVQQGFALLLRVEKTTTILLFWKITHLKWEIAGSKTLFGHQDSKNRVTLL